MHKYSQRILLPVVFVIGFLTSAQAATLTGAVAFGTNSNGRTNVLESFWNTNGGDLPFNLYLSTDVDWVNAGDGSGTSLNIPLLPGANTFRLFAQPGVVPLAFIGLNLFFDGSTTPSISVFTQPNSFSATGANLTPDSSNNTRGLTGFSIVPGAGTLGSADLQLTAFNWYRPLRDPDPTDSITSPVGNYVAPYNNAPDCPLCFLGIEGGLPDERGYFTITATPEPASVVLAGSAFMMIGALAWRRRRRAA